VTDRPFALQLIGSYKQGDIESLVARFELPSTVYLRRETLRGRPWLVLIHSLHPSYEEAQAELARLPPGLATLKPWIRNLPQGAGMEVLGTGQAR
jgi:DamX protein